MLLNSPKLNMPYIAPAQAQKHVTHNEALRTLDALVQLTLQSTVSAYPVSPTEGACYGVEAISGDPLFAQNGKMLQFIDGSWTFHTPQEGWLAWRVDLGKTFVFDGGVWKAAEPTPETFDHLGINASADDMNKLVVKSSATLLDNVGQGHQCKINKAASGDTASLLFQTGYAGHAEMGLAGDDDFHIKVSPDGSQFYEGVRVRADDGAVEFPQGTHPNLLVGAVPTAGGAAEVYGPPNLLTTCYTRSTVTLTQNRMYFCAFYVDRPTYLTGGMVALYTASTTSGSILRAGVCKLGAPADAPQETLWNIGEQIVDYGTHAADVAGGKDFTLTAPILLTPGWYVNALGTNGTGAKVRSPRWMTPGLLQYRLYGSGSSIDLRISGPGGYLYENNQNSEIVNGFGGNYPSAPVNHLYTANNFVEQMMVPKWQRW